MVAWPYLLFGLFGFFFAVAVACLFCCLGAGMAREKSKKRKTTPPERKKTYTHANPPPPAQTAKTNMPLSPISRRQNFIFSEKARALHASHLKNTLPPRRRCLGGGEECARFCVFVGLGGPRGWGRVFCFCCLGGPGRWRFFCFCCLGGPGGWRVVVLIFGRGACLCFCCLSGGRVFFVVWT